VDENNIQVEKIARCFGLFGDPQMTADARLIAAAPELYEALAQARQVLATYQPESAPTFYMEAIWNAEAALRKARGDS
jgi:hypothetical protein